MTSGIQDSPAVAAVVRALRGHYEGVVLPLWRGPGFNAGPGLPYEALGVRDARPLPPARYRTMACARQLFVFSQSSAPGDTAHAARLFDSLCSRFGHAAGGWVYSVGPDMRPAENHHDLYTYAFVVFACAAYFRRSAHARARNVMEDTVSVIEQRFAGPDGLYWAQLNDADWQPRSGLQQNPIMHLTEAYLAAREVAHADWYDKALRRIAQGVATRFLDPASQCVCELPVGDADNRIEPGHQFEWFALVRGAPHVFGGTVLAHAVADAAEFACRHGVEVDTQGVWASLALDGTVRDSTERIWAQTEYGRYLAMSSAPASRPLLARQLECLRARFLHAGGWYECLDAQGKVARADMPSTTPYHLATCYAALPGLA